MSRRILIPLVIAALLVGAGIAALVVYGMGSAKVEAVEASEGKKKKKKKKKSRKDGKRKASEGDEEGPQPPDKRERRKHPDRATSTLRVPVALSVDDLRDAIDRELPDEIMAKEGQQIQSDLKVDYEVKRAGRVKVSTRDGRIEVEVPVRMKGKALWSGLGRRFARQLPFEGRLTMLISVQVSLTSRWALRPRTKISHRWDKRVTLKAGILSVDISEAVDEQIEDQSPAMSKDLNKRIKAQVDARELGKQAWSKLRRPISIQKTPPLWLRVDPISASVARPTSKSGKLIIPVGLEANIEVVIGDKPGKLPRRNLPRLDTRPEGRDNTLSVYVPVTLSYEDATSLASKAIKEQTFPVQDGVKVEVKDLKITGNGDQLVVRLDYKATLPAGSTTEGHIFLTGTPHLDTDDQILSIKDFDYDLHTRNALLKTRDFMVHDEFVEEINKRLVFPLDDPLGLARKLIEKGIRDQTLSEHVDLKARLTHLELDHIDPGEEGIEAMVRLKGRSQAELNIED